VTKVRLTNTSTGWINIGCTLISVSERKSGLFLSALGGQEKLLVEKGPFGVLMGLMFASFILGWLGFGFTKIILIGLYLWFWKQSVNQKAREEHMEKEASLWEEHFKLYPNIESVEWIHKAIAQVYRRHGDALQTYITTMVNPQIDRFKPNFLKSIQIDSVSLGEIPPTLFNFKVNTRESNSVEIEFFLNYRSDLNILLSIRGGLGMVSVPVIIEKIVVYAHVHIRATYMDDFPFVRKVDLSVLEKPTIEFELRPLKGMDLTAFPGLSSWMNELINVIVIEQMLLSPKEFPLDIPQLLGIPAAPSK